MKSPSPTPHRRPRRFGLEKLVAVISILVIVILAAFFSVIAITQIRQSRMAIDSRNELAPVILDRHRMVINLQRMLGAGDMMIAATSPERRRESMLTARAIAGHPTFLAYAEARRLLTECAQTLQNGAELLSRRDALPADDLSMRREMERQAVMQWQSCRQRLETLADTLVVEGARLTTDRFEELADGSRTATALTLTGLACAIVLVIVLMMQIRRRIIVPVVDASSALHRIHQHQPFVPLIPTHIAEISTLQEDIAAVRGLIEDLYATREDLERSNADLEQFAYVASHDLREPLRMISGFLGLIERRYGEMLDKDGREFIAFANEGANRMDRLILDLLEYSRVGRLCRPIAPYPLEEAIQTAIASLTQNIHDAHATIDIGPDLPMVDCDPSEITRLFQNLLGNALKYRDPSRPPAIRITADRNDGFWRIDVADNGLGIEPQFHDRIFLLFQRLHTRDEYPGTGIGLAICKKIVERHGGKIWLDSTPGEGTTFHLTLPAPSPLP